MATHIILGFTETGRTAVPHALFTGQDSELAEATFKTPPEGIRRTVHVKNPLGRQRFHEVPEGVEFAEVLMEEIEVPDFAAEIEQLKKQVEEKDLELAKQVKTFDASWKSLTGEKEQLEKKLEDAQLQKVEAEKATFDALAKRDELEHALVEAKAAAAEKEWGQESSDSANKQQELPEVPPKKGGK